MTAESELGEGSKFSVFLQKLSEFHPETVRAVKDFPAILFIDQQVRSPAETSAGAVREKGDIQMEILQVKTDPQDLWREGK